MKPLKLLRVYRKLRIRQSVLCAIIVNDTQNYIKNTDNLVNELISVGKAVDKVIKIMPIIYFLFCEYSIVSETLRNLKEMGYNCDHDGNELRNK